MAELRVYKVIIETIGIWSSIILSKDIVEQEEAYLL